MGEVAGLMEGPSTFADDDLPRAFWVGGKQVVNLFSPERVELRLTKAVIRTQQARFQADPRVELRPNPSDWLTLVVTKAADADLVVELAELAAAAHRSARPPDRPPVPEGADLARRRRFH
jgi:hypothetical protein